MHTQFPAFYKICTPSGKVGIIAVIYSVWKNTANRLGLSVSSPRKPGSCEVLGYFFKDPNKVEFIHKSLVNVIMFSYKDASQAFLTLSLECTDF